MARRFIASVSFLSAYWLRYSSEDVVKEFTRMSVGFDGS